MKTIIGIFLAIFLFAGIPGGGAGIAFGQSARAELKADPAIQALGLSDEQLDEVLKQLADFYEKHDLQYRATLVRRRADEILSEDFALKFRFINDRAPERAAEEAAIQ